MVICHKNPAIDYHVRAAASLDAALESGDFALQFQYYATVVQPSLYKLRAQPATVPGALSSTRVERSNIKSLYF